MKRHRISFIVLVTLLLSTSCVKDNSYVPVDVRYTSNNLIVTDVSDFWGDLSEILVKHEITDSSIAFDVVSLGQNGLSIQCQVPLPDVNGVQWEEIENGVRKGYGATQINLCSNKSKILLIVQFELSETHSYAFGGSSATIVSVEMDNQPLPIKRSPNQIPCIEI